MLKCLEVFLLSYCPIFSSRLPSNFRFTDVDDKEAEILLISVSCAECKTIASVTYDTLAFSVWTLPECKSIVSANFSFLFLSVNLVF